MAVREVFIISDSTGELATRYLRSALDQFSDVEVADTLIAKVREPLDIIDGIRRAKEHGAFVIYTLVEKELLTAARSAVTQYGVPAIELLTKDLVPKLGEWLKQEPLHRPGHKLDKEYFQRLEAMVFAVQHDDGQRMDELDLADVVIVGVSRTSKTPLCLVLAQRGLKAANVPIVLEAEPPAELFRVNSKRVVALSVTPERLQQVRERRESKMGLKGTSYTDLERIFEEQDKVRRLALKNSWRTIDMTCRAVEEAAAMIDQQLAVLSLPIAAE